MARKRKKEEMPNPDWKKYHLLPNSRVEGIYSAHSKVGEHLLSAHNNSREALFFIGRNELFKIRALEPF
jgi:hypothetical protein